MQLFKGISEVTSAVKGGSKQIKKVGKIAVLKYSNLTAKDEITALYTKLGELYYKDHGLDPDVGYEAYCDKITDLRTAINENNYAINEIKIDGIVDDEVVSPEEVE